MLEVAEPAEQIGQRDRERAHRGVGRQRLGRAERLGGRAADRRPVPGRPPRPGAARDRAALQDDGRRVCAGPPVAHVVAVMERGSGRVQRLDQTRQCPPVHGSPAWDAPGAVAAQLQWTQCLQRGGLLRPQRGVPVEVAAVERRAPVRGHDTGGNGVVADGGSGQRAGHAVAPGFSVSMAMRCACNWFIERFSWPARSRPDRWM